MNRLTANFLLLFTALLLPGAGSLSFDSSGPDTDLLPHAGDATVAERNGAPLSGEVPSSRASINGFLRDAETGETLLGANILLEGTGRGATTNHSGYYVINSIPPGSYTLRFSYLGYKDERRELVLREGENLRLDIELDPAGFTMEELVITSRRELEERQNIGSASVSTELIKSVPSVLQADVFRAVQLLPGVKAASDFSSGLYIRGGGPDQTLILLDRTTVYNPSHFF
ncbi:MAG: carboxypeptidase-like regulatory domain-containing protein, partial [Cyclonatronaceae bacterium]